MNGHDWETLKADALHRYERCRRCGQHRIVFLSNETGQPDLSFLKPDPSETPKSAQLELDYGGAA